MERKKRKYDETSNFLKKKPKSVHFENPHEIYYLKSELQSKNIIINQILGQINLLKNEIQNKNNIIKEIILEINKNKKSISTNKDDITILQEEIFQMKKQKDFPKEESWSYIN
uniref:Uncharacterized protein n=1 Tax=Mimiviridae sp. ChoanoV1 TaxID=2596887 RepID=A0A5B8IR23_9VIRU|nr:hypothetical protein 9_5 [Mimiviridae sp. ChoanoV1]